MRAGATLAALFAAIVISLPAHAQDDPLRFLRPALEGEGAPPSTGAVEMPADSGDEVSPLGQPSAEAAPPVLPPDDASHADPLQDEPPLGGEVFPSVPPEEESDSIISLPGETPPVAAPLRFGVVVGRDLAVTMAAIAPIEAGLAAATGRPVEFLPMATYGALIDSQIARRLDGGFFSASAFAFAEAECACLEPLVAPAAADGTTAYHALIVVRRGSQVQVPADLAGRTIAAGPADSVGLKRIQLAELEAQAGDGGFAGTIRETASGDDAVRLLLAGDVDAAFAWSSLAGDESDGYSRGTFRDLVATGELEMKWLRVVWASPPIGHSPFAAARALPPELRQAIEDYFLTLRDAEPEAYDALNPLYGGGYRPVSRDNYAALSALAAPSVIAGSSPAAGEGSIGR